MNLEDYPKESVLTDGSRFILRPMVAEDAPGLRGFFENLPPAERIFARDDDIDPIITLPWPKTLDYQRVLPILALAGGGIIGMGALHHGDSSWITHIGNIRITVAPDRRRKGLGWILAGELFRNALHRGLEKIVAEVVEDQVGVSLFYNHLGFYTEAHLQGHFLDEQGSKHDILIMSNELRQLWKIWVEGTGNVRLKKDARMR